MLTFTTVNTVWELDPDNGRYRRSPRAERNPEHGNVVYGEWQPMTGWDVEPVNGGRVLVVRYPDSECGAEKEGLPCAGKHFIVSSVIADAAEGAA